MLIGIDRELHFHTLKVKIIFTVSWETWISEFSYTLVKALKACYRFEIEYCNNTKFDWGNEDWRTQLQVQGVNILTGNGM